MTETKWGRMLAFSIMCHLGVFSVFLFTPESYSERPVDGVVYEVSLVEMPAEVTLEAPKNAPAGAGAAKTPAAKEAKAKRIPAVQKREPKPLVVAKRTAPKTAKPVEKPKTSPSELIDRAIDKIERKVQSDEKSHLDKALADLERRTVVSPGSGASGGKADLGIPIRIYQMEVESRIKGYWSYPVAVEGKKDLEAVVVLKVKGDGTIMDTRFKKKSPSALFDQSVLKAVERSNPLPPFPEGYKKGYDEIEINFNLRELENH